MTVSLNLKNGSVGQSTSGYSWLSHTKDNLTAELRVGIDNNNSTYIDGIANYISLPPIRLKKTNSDIEGGTIIFESADNEVNARKRMWIERYNGKFNFIGSDSSATLREPLQADIQNDCVNITNAYINNACQLQKDSSYIRYIVKDLGYAQGDTVSPSRSWGFNTCDKNNVTTGAVYSQIDTYGNASTILWVRTPVAGSTKSSYMGITASKDGTFSTFALTPSSATNNSTEIATTAHIINVLKLMYPVGSVYIGTQSTCPMSQLFGTWSLVSSGKALWTGNGSNGNTTINAGLPNITGTFSSANLNEPQNAYGTGAFSITDTFSTNRGRDYEGFVNGTKFDFDASRSNNIYGKSSTVQPPAYVVNVWRRTA